MKKMDEKARKILRRLVKKEISFEEAEELLLVFML